MVSAQSTFGDLKINHYHGERRCDKLVGYDEETGEPQRCKNNAKIAVLPGSQIARFYCGVHTKDTWEEMTQD